MPICAASRAALTVAKSGKNAVALSGCRSGSGVALFFSSGLSMFLQFGLRPGGVKAVGFGLFGKKRRSRL
jgi:hypothetical protein